MYRYFSVFLVLAAGCSPEQGFKSTDTEAREPAPDIEVNPLHVSFSTLSSGEQDTKTFTVTNVGAESLEVSNIFIESGDAFSLLTAPLDFTLAAGDSRNIEVAFTPLQVTNGGTAVVQSDDPDQPEVYVDLTGSGAVPELVINPNPADMGQNFLPCSSSETLELTNIGPEPLTIDEMSYKGNMMALTQNNVLPVTLYTDDVIFVDVDFTPTLVGKFDGTLSVVSNDPRGVVNGLQQGEGVHVGYGTDDFMVTQNPPVDILFAVDQSCSMDTPAAALGSAFSTFIGTINSVTTGWQIGVTTLDSGCFNSGVLHSGVSGYTSLFQSAVTVGTDSSVTTDEQLFTQVQVALSKTGPSGCNAGFLRPGAMLHVIFVSDECEQSGNQGYCNSSNTHFSSFAGNYASYKGGNPSLVKVSGIVNLGASPNPNAPPNGTGAYATACGIGSSPRPGGYVDMAMASGGEVLNICDSNWAQKTEDLALASLSGAGAYSLSGDADPDSIEVLVNGVPTNNWTWDPNTGSVIVTEPLDDGDNLSIDYGLFANCP